MTTYPIKCLNCETVLGETETSVEHVSGFIRSGRCKPCDTASVPAVPTPSTDPTPPPVT